MSPSLRASFLLGFSALVLAGAGCALPGTSSKSLDTAADGGIFHTINAGDTWAQTVVLPTIKGIGSLAGANIVALSVDPQDADVWYAGTRENGLVFSLDGAASWQRPRLDVLRDGVITAVEADAKSTCTLYVAKPQRLYKTVDCLRSFDQDAFVETRSNVHIVGITVDWYNPKNIWLAENNGDVQKSEDGAKTWRRVLNGSHAITALLMSRSDSRMVMVGTSGNGFFRTVDGGKTWTQSGDELKKMRGADTVSGLAQDVKGTTLVAATNYGLLRSKDFGVTWEPLSLLTAPGQLKIQALAVGPASGDMIAYAVAGTFYRSLDGGKNWTTHQLISGRTPTKLLVDPKTPAAYFLSVLAPEKK